MELGLELVSEAGDIDIAMKDYFVHDLDSLFFHHAQIILQHPAKFYIFLV